jgi:class 3 adenylate cyclase/tetratricopeptide (TPR) repeat protein
VTPTCPACRETDLPEGSRFCLACGTELPGEHEAPADLSPYTPPHLAREVLVSRTAREGERKQVTVLFADIAGSLAMAEALDPEEIHVVMDGFFSVALDAVHAEKGTINQFRGDGFMALFGAPLARDEDAARALRAALAIRDANERYGRSIERRFGVPLLVRMGLHSGAVWVGSIGKDLRWDYTAEGPTVGLAARLERAARPGQILLSDETAQRTRPYFETRELGVRRFAGVSRAVRVFELVAEGPHQARFEVQRVRGLTPFVGRERELARLERAARAGEQLALVEIRGEAGIGKSRLVHEHVSRATADAVLEARCREADAARAYSPFLGLLRSWPSNLAGAEGAARLAQRFGGDASQVSGTREEFASQLGELLASAARARPLLLVLEDAHWLDPSSRAVLRALSRDPSLRGLSLIATVRSEHGGLPETEGPLERIDLGPLGSEPSETLCRTVLGELDDPETLVALALERGAGNPLFIEEVSRALREGPDAMRKAARVETKLRRSRFRVPETLNGVIAARIDSLPDISKRLLHSASVIGLPFDRELLERVAGEAELDLPAVLDDLVERGLLRSSREAAFEFRHVLTQQVAYDQLLLARRRVLHRRCADTLAARGLASTPDGASRIGSHYEQGDAPRRAIEHLARAGRAYLKTRAPDEAATHLQRAWEIQLREPDADPALRASVGLALSTAYNALDRAGKAGEVLESLQSEGLESRDRQRLARACIEGGWVRFSEESDAEAGRRLIERGIALTDGIPEESRVQIGAHAYLARLHSLDGEVGRSVAHAECVEKLAGELDDSFFQMFGLGAKGSALCHSGDLKSAFAACLKSTALAEESENEVAIGFAQMFLAEVYVYLGKPREAIAAAERARSAGERSRQVAAMYQSTVWSGEAYLLQGQAARAVEEFEALAAINSNWPSTLLFQARGLVALGRWRGAVVAAEACLARRPPRLVRARALCVLGLALGLSEPPQLERAIDALDESRRLCEARGLLPHLAEVKGALAEVRARYGDLEQARDLAAQAVQIFESCRMHLHAQRVRLPAPA